jgi:hypothetical protein
MFAERMGVMVNEFVQNALPPATRQTERYLQAGIRQILYQMALELGGDPAEITERYSFRFEGLTPDETGLFPLSGHVNVQMVDSMAHAPESDRDWSNTRCWGPEVQYRGEW